MSLPRAGRTFAAAGVATLLLATAPAAMATHSTISASVAPAAGKPGTPLTLAVGFTIARENGESATLRRIVLDLPANAVANSSRFPSCSAAAINRRRTFNVCPEGSKVGGGSLVFDVPQAPAFDLPGRVTLFNGPGGRSITVHVFAETPVRLSTAFSASLRRTRGRYGYRLSASLPHALQEIRSGWFAEVKRFDAVVRAAWHGRGYLEATTCPRGGRAAIGGAFDFLQQARPTSALGFVSCRR